jgi:hypothetical protein
MDRYAIMLSEHVGLLMARLHPNTFEAVLPSQ